MNLTRLRAALPQIQRSIRPSIVRSFSSSSSTSPTAAYRLVPSGTSGTLEWRGFFDHTSKDGTGRLSPWHDIPLHLTSNRTVYTYINEIPKGTRPKLELA